MRVLVQRVSYASCTVEKEVVGKIDKGYLLLIGFGLEDDESKCETLAKKIINLRIFNDEEGKMNLDLKQVNGSILAISQFTLYANSKKGNRPSFTEAMKGEKANYLYEYFLSCLKEHDINLEKGIFGADMKIDLCNDGPVTILLEE